MNTTNTIQLVIENVDKALKNYLKIFLKEKLLAISIFMWKRF